MNSHAPLRSFDPYSDRVANASMLHKISLDLNCWFTVMTITGGPIVVSYALGLFPDNHG
jgi:hypothetical protein